MKPLSGGLICSLFVLFLSDFLRYSFGAMSAQSEGPFDEKEACPTRGRGAVSNATGRFEPTSAVAIDDGWDLGADDLATLRTHVTDETPRRIISTNTSPDIPFEKSINPYRGCEHGCVYCYARPSHAYMGLSPGLDFESRLFAKPSAALLLEKELRKPGYKPSLIMLGANTDPYQPLEKRRQITRSILRVLSDFNHPAVIITKSHLVTRDIDILAPMAERGLVSVAVSITTLDRGLANKMEPRAATPMRRLDAVRQLSEAGIPTAVMAAPMIPALNDFELEAILTAAREAGAGSAGYILLRLPHEIKDLFAEWLVAHAPLKAEHVLSVLGNMRGGRLYDPAFGRRMRGQGPFADLLEHRFHLAALRLGLSTHVAVEGRLRSDLFRPPPRAGDQLSLSLT